MAPKPRLDPSRTTAILLLLAAATRAHSYDSDSAKVASVVPSCAQDCLQSFVHVNFPDIDCSEASSKLECVCQRTGASGFTVGEGAVQCLLASKSVAICSDEDANEGVIGSAYQMCENQPNAAQPTHPTIEATFRLDKSSRLIIPTPSPTTAISTSSAASAPTTTASPVTVSASFSQTSAPPAETDTASGPGDAEGAENEDEESRPSGDLNTAEIAGLAAGLVAALALAVVAICLARRHRRKHFPDIETSFFMSNDRLKALSRRFTSMPTGQNISSPLHGSPNAPPMEFPMGEYGALHNRRRTFIFPQSTQRTVPPVRQVPTGTAAPVAGLAVTAASAVPMAASSSSSSSPRNTQKKPVLSLSIPKNSATPAPGQQKPAPKQDDPPPKLLVTAPTFETEKAAKNSRKEQRVSKPTIRAVEEEDDSPLTEFEEDDRDSPIQVWRPPSLAPQSATTLYVADKFGNWVLADERQKKRISLAELEGSSPVVTREVNTIPAQGTSTSAPELPKTAGVLQPPAEIHRRGETRREMPSVSSSVYSSDIPGWNTSPAPPVPTHPMLPKPLATRQGQRPSPRPRYSPVLNPFLDENGVSPVRSKFGSRRGPTHTYASPQVGSRGPPRVRSPPGQSSPTLGVAKPASYGRRTPQQRTGTPQQPRTPEPRTYSPAPSAALGPSPSRMPISLLAKRVGAEKAASLSLRDSEGSKGTGRGSGRGSGEQGQLPSTPTWNPLLTPERRGDDLYLSLR